MVSGWVADGNAPIVRARILNNGRVIGADALKWFRGHRPDVSDYLRSSIRPWGFVVVLPLDAKTSIDLGRDALELQLEASRKSKVLKLSASEASNYGGLLRAISPYRPAEQEEVRAMLAEAGGVELAPVSEGETNDIVWFDAAHVTEHDVAADGTRNIRRGVIAGWSVGPEPLTKIEFFIQGEKVAAARLGLFRPDVGSLHPHRRHANQAGFEAHLTEGRLPGGDVALTLVATTSTGRVFSAQERLVVHDGRRPAGVMPMHMAVERCDLDDSNVLCVVGWAVSVAPILAIQVFAGNERIATTSADRSRPDIHAAFPTYPNAERAGFSTTVTIPKQLRSSIDTLAIEVIARDGTTRREVMAPRRVIGTPSVTAPAPAALPTVSKLHARPLGATSRASAPNDFRYHCDTATLDTNGRLRATGWIVAKSAVAALFVDASGERRGRARLGRSRLDVGSTFPGYPSASDSGFELVAELPGPLSGEQTITFIAELANGSTRTFKVTAVAVTPSALRTTSDDALISVDGMQIESGHARRVINGSFHLVGWAIARAGVASVEVFLDGDPIGRAYHGIRREDVAATFPAFPDALVAGFGLSIPARTLRSGRSRFRLVMTDREGTTTEFEFTADIVKEEGRDRLHALRHKVSYAEIATTLAILESRGPLPVFDLALRISHGAAAIAAAVSTATSLALQAYPEWRLWLVATDADVDVSEFVHAVADAVPEHAGRITSIAEYSEPSPPRLVGVLEAGDTIAMDGLLELALAVGDRDAGDFFYGDDRRCDPTGTETCAFFKPDWSPDLVLTQNYVGRAWVATDALLGRLGLDFPELARIGDYAIVLIATDAAVAIRHVRSLVLEMGTARESVEVERRTLAAHVERTGLDADVLPGAASFLHRLNRRPPIQGKVSIIIPSIGAKNHVIACLASIRNRTKGVEYEIIVVDNLRESAMTDETRRWKSWFREHADVVIAVDEPFNWSRLNNLGAAAATGDFFLFLNDDTEVLSEDWLSILRAEAARPEVGVVGSQLLYGDGKVQHAGVFMSRTDPGTFRHAFRFAEADDPGYFGLALSQRNVLCVTGACMMVRRDVFEAIGRFDEAHSVVNNDVDFCLRLHRSGRLIVFTPHVRLTHFELASRASLKDEYDRSAFLSRWSDLCEAGDPFHHPRISSNVDDYSLEEENVREVYAGFPLGNRTGVRRILVVKLDHIGDLVTSLPAIRRLKMVFPHAHLTALVGRSCVGIASMEGAIDEVVPFDFFDARSGLGRKKLTEDDYTALRENLRARRFDLAVDLRKIGDTRHILQYSRAPILAGYDHEGEHPWLDIALEWERDSLQKNKRTHIANDLLNLVDAVGNAFVEDRRTIQPQHGLPELTDALKREFAELFGGDYVIVHPAAGNPARQWSPTAFARLIDLLVEEDGVRVALLGGPDERAIADEVLEHVKNRESVFDLVGRSKLSEVPRIIAESVLFVGNNSGPSHIAAGVGTPTVSVHSAVVASEEWGPLGPQAVAIRRDMSCGPCYIASAEQCHRGMECLHSLSPFMVHRVCRRFLSLRAGKGLAH